MSGEFRFGINGGDAVSNKTTITQNKLNSLSVGVCSFCSLSLKNIILSNNIIENDIPFDHPSIEFISVNNNIFLGRVISFHTLVFQNNILTYNQSNFALNIISGGVYNNICAAAQLGTINGNKDYDPAAKNLFVDPASVNNSPDRSYQLKSNSPFIAAGVGGIQPGIFGGPTPYEISGLPPIPAIYEITTTGTGSTQSGLPITIKIKSY